MQQAELLSSLAMRVNTENTDQSLESAWKVKSMFFVSLVHLSFFEQIDVPCDTLLMKPSLMFISM